jgi:archaellum biogenesis ATPase FlaH
VRTVEVLKVNDVDLIRNNEVSFEIEPGKGIKILPYSTARA